MALKINENIQVNNGLDLKTISNDSIYSTNEVKIGTWIDGKPLYRKIYNTVTSVGAASEYIATMPQNVETITKFEGVIIDDDDVINANYYWDANNYSCLYCVPATRNIYNKSMKYHRKTLYIIIEYTKTTD